jgi:phosphatidylinositol dimannoside acyltransferase
MGETLASLGYRAGWAALRWIPEAAGRRAFDLMADRAWRRRGAGVRRLEANLRRVLGADTTPARLRETSRAGMRSYLRYFYEAFRLPALGGARLRARTRCEGIEALEAHIAAGRGVVAALPHMGNWDHAGAWMCDRGVPLTTVAERLRPEGLYRRFVAFRESLGMEVLALTGEAGTFATLVRRLRAGRLVCLLADRDLTDSGVEVEFFGEAARFPAGPAALAVSTGAALMPVTLWYEGEQLRIRVHEELPVPSGGARSRRVQEATQSLARVFETAIAEHPEDWHMLQRVFSADSPVPDAPAGRG